MQIGKQWWPFTDWKIESNGAAPVNVQDQTSEVIDLYFCSEILVTSLTSNIIVGSKTINVVNATGATPGDCIDIFENGRVFQAIVQTVVGLAITFSVPSDQAFTTAAIVNIGKWNMNINGSVTSKVYEVGPPPGVKWDITKVVFGITDNSAMDYSTFGGMAALANGLVLRIKDGYYKTLFVVNDNGGMSERGDVEYSPKAPSGSYGLKFIKRYSGQENHGVTLRLDGDTNDKLEILIQDDLTPLIKLAALAHGHVVTS